MGEKKYYGKPKFEVKIESGVGFGKSTSHFRQATCARCGEEKSDEQIGNGDYCDDCADDIWENVT